MDVQTFVVRTSRDRSTKDLLKAGKYDSINPLVKPQKFPLQRAVNGERTLVLLEFEHAIDTFELAAEMSRLRLARPVYDDAFLMGAQFPEEQLKGPIVFPHDPPYFWSGYAFQFVLGSKEQQRTLQLVASGGRWHSKYRFALVRP